MHDTPTEAPEADGSPPTLWTEIAPALLERLADCPRAAAFEQAAERAVRHLADRLPGELAIELHPAFELPSHLTAQPAVGCHVLAVLGAPVDDHRVAVAIGHDPADGPEDAAWWQARLVSVVHELLHLADWWQAHAATPHAAGTRALVAWSATASSCDDLEHDARRIADRLLADLARPGTCPPRCADLHDRLSDD